MTLLERTHAEDVKAAIRKRYRSMAAFERAEGLARQSVYEVLRGRPSARAKTAIERILREQIRAESINTVSSPDGSAPHRLNAEAR